ncbi:MAG: hypothetical protein AAF282_05540 [Cyanobacteria bacterium P01_A01_bin.15]
MDGLTKRETAQNPALDRVLTYYPPGTYSVWGNSEVEVAYFEDLKEAMVISGDFEVVLVEDADSAEDAAAQWQAAQPAE